MFPKYLRLAMTSVEHLKWQANERQCGRDSTPDRVIPGYRTGVRLRLWVYRRIILASRASIAMMVLTLNVLTLSV